MKGKVYSKKVTKHHPDWFQNTTLHSCFAIRKAMAKLHDYRVQQKTDTEEAGQRFMLLSDKLNECEKLIEMETGKE